MKRNVSKWTTISCLLLSLLVGCKKEIRENSVKTSQLGKNTLTPYGFDWEVGDFMPTPSGTSILKPWASGANRSFPRIFGTDIKKSDGWELVYNTFSPQQFIQPAYFVLYNRYRGLLRAYFYLTPSTPIPSSNVSHTLIQDAGSGAPTLTYSGLSAADLSTTTNNAELIQQYKTTATGTWYAEEFDMAYDPAVGTKDATTNLMVWQLNSINVSNLAINGTSQGGINGTIAQPNPPGPSLFGSVINGALSFAGYEALGGFILKAATRDIEKKAIESLRDAAKAGFTGQAKNVANGIFGGASSGGDSSKMYVHLTTNTNYKLTGSSTDIYSLAYNSMVIPGSRGQESVTGYAPVYRNPLGIMTLSHAPTSHLTYYNIPSGIAAQMQLNNNSYSILWNPSIINSNNPNGATIQNLKQEFISYEWYYGESTYYWSGASNQEYDGLRPYLKNDLAADNYIRFEQRSTCYGCDNSDVVPVDDFEVGQKLPNHVLRISFDVVPNNGAPRIKIAKSFNIILEGITYPGS